MITDQKKYYNSLRDRFLDFFENNQNVQVFIFGSSTNSEKFGDIDVGIMGKVTDQEIRELKDYFENSTFPFFVDIINFNTVDNSFKNNVLNNKVIWIKHSN